MVSLPLVHHLVELFLRDSARLDQILFGRGAAVELVGRVVDDGGSGAGLPTASRCGLRAVAPQSIQQSRDAVAGAGDALQLVCKETQPGADHVSEAAVAVSSVDCLQGVGQHRAHLRPQFRERENGFFSGLAAAQQLVAHRTEDLRTVQDTALFVPLDSEMRNAGRREGKVAGDADVGQLEFRQGPREIEFLLDSRDHGADCVLGGLHLADDGVVDAAEDVFHGSASGGQCGGDRRADTGHRTADGSAGGGDLAGDRRAGRLKCRTRHAGDCSPCGSCCGVHR